VIKKPKDALELIRNDLRAARGNLSGAVRFGRGSIPDVSTFQTKPRPSELRVEKDKTLGGGEKRRVCVVGRKKDGRGGEKNSQAHLRGSSTPNAGRG